MSKFQYALKEKQERIISLVNQMLAAKKELQIANIESDKKFIKQRIKILDSQINEEVYRLYDLSKEDIEIIESSLSSSNKEQN